MQSLAKNQYAMLSMVWCERFNIPLTKQGVLVKPEQVKSFLSDAFIHARDKWESVRGSITRQFSIPDDAAKPYEQMMERNGPAFFSLHAILSSQCGGTEEGKSPVETFIKTTDLTNTKHHLGFDTYSAPRVYVQTAIDTETLTDFVYKALKSSGV
jgi:hypothetical protein